jgi:hypothetical protein
VNVRDWRLQVVLAAGTGVLRRRIVTQNPEARLVKKSGILPDVFPYVAAREPVSGQYDTATTWHGRPRLCWPCARCEELCRG